MTPGLATLNWAEWCGVLCHLGPCDVNGLLQTSHAIRVHLDDERIWHGLCELEARRRDLVWEDLLLPWKASRAKEAGEQPAVHYRCSGTGAGARPGGCPTQNQVPGASEPEPQGPCSLPGPCWPSGVRLGRRHAAEPAVLFAATHLFFLCSMGIRHPAPSSPRRTLYFMLTAWGPCIGVWQATDQDYPDTPIFLAVEVGPWGLAARCVAKPPAVPKATRHKAPYKRAIVVAPG